MQTLPFDTGSGPPRYRVFTGENDDLDLARRGSARALQHAFEALARTSEKKDRACPASV